MNLPQKWDRQFRLTGRRALSSFWPPGSAQPEAQQETSESLQCKREAGLLKPLPSFYWGLHREMEALLLASALGKVSFSLQLCLRM